MQTSHQNQLQAAGNSGKDTENLLPNILGGILKHIEEITYFLNSTDNSYNRLGASKAPEYISWGKENRSTLIRVPSSTGTKRLELRSPDPLCNTYLALTLLIEAAIEGIKNKIEPSAETTENLFDENIAKQTSLKALPKSLAEAKRIAENSEFVKRVLGAVVTPVATTR